MATEKIESKTLRQEVYDKLRNKIISAEILPGETITLRELAQKFQVSLMPVREALWQLEAQKIIVIESNRIIRVNQMTSEEMQEALRLRILLECMAAERACERRPEKAITKTKALLESMKAAAGKRPKIYMRKNNDFHFTIYAHADSPLLMDIIEQLRARVGPYVYRYAVHNRDLGKAMECHEKMFEGFAEKDPKKLSQALCRDLEEAANSIIPFLEK